MVLKNELYPIHFYGRVRGKCDGRLQNWPGIANERPKFLAMRNVVCLPHVTCKFRRAISLPRVDCLKVKTLKMDS